jgi:dTMP kinase
MLITFEGPEGSGKSSQIAMLSGYLSDRGHEVLLTREPGGTAIGDQIRHVLHDTANLAMAAQTELLLYSASRAQLVRELILPALERGQVVLCDRYADSTLAYQGYGRGLNRAELEVISRFATGGLRPDLTLLLDVDVEAGLQRRREGELEMNRLDLETLAFHKRVREGYLQMAADDPARWVVIDAARSPAEVHRDAANIVEARLAKRG